MLTAVASAPAKSPPMSRPLGSLLLIDENSDDLYTYTRMLRREGYEIRACASCPEGARSLETGRFDVVIISQGGPGFEWRSLLEQAIKVDSLRPVLVITDCVDMKCYVDAMWLGATDYLEKPRSSEELLKTIGRLLSFLGNCA